MSPELGLVVFVTLLWGPTALWLGYRAFRVHRGNSFRSSSLASEPKYGSQSSPDELGALVDRDGFWVCWSCRSLNRREASHCYGCQAAMVSVGQQVPGEPPVRRMVPVMAEGIARSFEGAPWTTVAIAATENDLPAPEIFVRDPVPVLSSAPREAPVVVPVCPFLGLRDDPSTRCDFPDPRNLCHAASTRGATLFAFPRQFVTGKAGSVRAQPIDAELQKSTCLTATHERCARYPAVEAAAASR
jgi:hypothetical protein